MRDHHPDATKKVDVAAVVLIAVGLVCFVVGMVAFLNTHMLLLLPFAALFAVYTGYKHVFKYEAPRDVVAPIYHTEGTS